MQVEEEAEPGGRLVLGHGGDDRDVDFGIARVPQGVEPGTRRTDRTLFVVMLLHRTCY